MQDFLRMYSNLVEKCFNTCVNDFTSKALSSKEVFSLHVTGMRGLEFIMLGNMYHELHGEIHQAFGKSWCPIRRIQRRSVPLHTPHNHPPVFAHNPAYRGNGGPEPTMRDDAITTCTPHPHSKVIYTLAFLNEYSFLRATDTSQTIRN